MPIRDVLVLGAGSAGLMAALTLKRKLPDLAVRVVRSPEMGVIGVGEGTTPSFPKHFFEYLKLKPQQFYARAEPTWKLGVKFLWGPRPEFYYTFAYELQQRLPELRRNNGFYFSEEFKCAGPMSAFMAEDKAFPRRPDGAPIFHTRHAFHVENVKLVAWLEDVCRALGVVITDATVSAIRGENGIDALITEDGARMTADLYVDASGFRSELLGRALQEDYISYSDALFCDRAVIGGWSRSDEPIKPYTVAETMDSGWCWQIEHENWINRGYVYSSSFITDDEARAEFLRKNPKVANEPRLVKFRSGRCRRSWVGNVVGIGNAVGFVEPLEASALQVICVGASTLADSLVDSLCDPPPTLIALYNRYNGQAWDDIRDFLATHYAFNTRLNTDFWKAARNDTNLHSAQYLVDFYKENGPSVVAGDQLLHPSNAFGMDGYLTLLVAQNVPHAKPHEPTPEECVIWRNKYNAWLNEARRGLDVKQCLSAIRGAAPKWGN
jgi:tryptophan 7-halogenase